MKSDALQTGSFNASQGSTPKHSSLGRRGRTLLNVTFVRGCHRLGSLLSKLGSVLDLGFIQGLILFAKRVLNVLLLRTRTVARLRVGVALSILLFFLGALFVLLHFLLHL